MVAKFVERPFQRHQVCSIPSSYEGVMTFESWVVDKEIRPGIIKGILVFSLANSFGIILLYRADLWIIVFHFQESEG